MNRLDIVILAGVLTALFAGGVSQGGQPAVVITNPVSAVQYSDAIVIRVDGFDVLRRQYPQLRLEVSMLGADDVAGPKRSVDLSSSWEQPSVILQKEPGTTCNGILVALRSGGTVVLRQLIGLAETVSNPVVPLTNTVAVIEPGQYMGPVSPAIPLPDFSRFATTNFNGPPPRTVNAQSIKRQVRCPVNHPMIASFNCAALTRQTSEPANPAKRSIYMALKSQLFDQQSGQPTSVAHYLCEVPLDAAWLNGTNNLNIVLTASDIKVHATTNQYQGWKPYPVCGESDSGLGQITMAVDADGNIYYPNVPAELVRFRVATAEFEIPPVYMTNFLTQCLPPSNSIYGAAGPDPWRGRWSPNDARYVVGMTLSNPGRMFYLACFQRVVDAGAWKGLHEWAGLFSIPTGSWTDKQEFTNGLRFLVGSWTNYPSFYDSLPASNDNRRVSFVGWPSRTYGNTLYLTNYTGTQSGHWRVDMGADGTMTNFGTPATLGPGFYDGYAKPRELKPNNAQGYIDFANYGRLTMTRNQLYYCLTGTLSTSYTGSVEIVYDAMGYMADHRQQSAAFSNILTSAGGPSLAPAYMATAIPGENGQVLGVGEYSYYLSRFDTTTNAIADVNKTYLQLELGNTNVSLPMAAGLGPYDHRWQAEGNSNWLHIAGYIGLTRLLYSGSGSSTRFTMDNYGSKLATVDLDRGSNGPIKWYRYMAEGLDDRLFVTGSGEADRSGTAYSGGLMSYDGKRRNNTLWKLSYLSRCYDTSRLRTRIVRKSDDTRVQEFCISGNFNAIYGAAIASNTVPTNQAAKLFFYAFETNAMKDVYGFSQAAINGSDDIDCLSYSPDRRYLVMLRGSRFLTFDPQEKRFVDGRNLTYTGTNVFLVQEFSRPDYSLIQTPDNRLICYVTSNTVTATNALFIEVGVSAEGLLSFTPCLGVTATNAAPLVETYGSVLTFLPDLAHQDGSYDLFIGMSPSSSKKGTVCRLVEDFVPPRSVEPPRRISVLSKPVAGAAVGGSQPGTTPYVAVCTNGDNVTVGAVESPDGRAFVRWEDEDGAVLSQATNYTVSMTQDLALIAVLSSPPPVGLMGMTHTAGVWSANRTITVRWAAAPVENNIAGYAYLFASAPGASAPTNVTTTGTNATFTVPADGTWWFVVRSVDSSGNWGPSVELGPFLIGFPSGLPFEDSFESYSPGSVVAGTNGWTGATNAGIVTALTYAAAFPPGYPMPQAVHSRVLHIDKALQNRVPGASNQNVSVDFMVQPMNGVTPVAPTNAVQLGLCVDTQGVVRVWHFFDNGGTWTQRWTALGNRPFATGQWIRVSVEFDYTNNAAGHTLFRPALDGAACPTAYGVAGPTNLAVPGSWYVCADSPAAGGGGARKISVFNIEGDRPCRIDDFVVTIGGVAYTPPGTLLMIQ